MEPATFPIPAPADFVQAGPPFQFYDREQVGCISIDGMGEVHIDSTSEQRELKSSHDLEGLIGQNLSEGSDNFQFVPYRHKPETLYEWIDNKGINFLKKEQIGFVTSRGALSDISTTLYDDRNLPLQFDIRKDNGIIYITFPNIREKSDESAGLGLPRRIPFEYMATYDNTNPHPTNNIHRYSVVCKTTLGLGQSFEIKTESFKILFSGVIPAIIRSEHPGYAHLKTINWKRLPTGFTVMKWWTQAHIIGLNKIVVGAYKPRTRTSEITDVMHYTIADSEEFKRQMGIKYENHPQWRPAHCFKFCFDVLKFIAEHIENDDPTVVYKLTKVEQNLVLEQVEDEASEDIVVPLPTQMEGVSEISS